VTAAHRIDAVYKLVDAGADIMLYDGPIAVGDVEGTGRIWLQTTGDLEHRWSLDGDDHPALDLGDAKLAFTHPAFGPIEMPVNVSSSRGRGEILSTGLGAARRLDEVVAHWVDVPAILPAERLEAPSGSWAGRWTATGGGWNLTPDARPDRPAVEAASAGNPVHAVTHVALLRRDDGSSFTPAEAEDALQAWHVTLSFALGRWVPPMLAVGFDGGARAWELWASWRSDSLRTRYAWWDTYQGDDLRSFALLDAWSDPSRREKVRYVAHHIIEANESAMTLEARIMLVSAALEYLSWVNNVLEGGRSASAHKKLKASETLAELLAVAGISTMVPPELAVIEKLRGDKKHLNGPEAVVWGRNRLVHPKDTRGPYRLAGLVIQTWQLLMQYGELLLLFEVGYVGSYYPRFPPGHWAHDSVPVPWIATPVVSEEPANRATNTGEADPPETQT
jgi:hypothetical protein